MTLPNFARQETDTRRSHAGVRDMLWSYAVGCVPGATIAQRLLSAWNVADVMGKLHFTFYFLLLHFDCNLEATRPLCQTELVRGSHTQWSGVRDAHGRSKSQPAALCFHGLRSRRPLPSVSRAGTELPIPRPCTPVPTQGGPEEVLSQ